MPITRQAQRIFQSTRPSRASTVPDAISDGIGLISIHKALAGLDRYVSAKVSGWRNFNPQGPRGPRRSIPDHHHYAKVISIHKALAGLDERDRKRRGHEGYFNPQGPRGPRPLQECIIVNQLLISIHKALAGLDSKTIQQSLHIPLTFYALCPPLLISTSSIHSPSLFSRLFRCFSGANLPGISC